MSLRIGAQLSNVQKTIQVLALGNRLRVAKFPHLFSIFVEDYHQVRFAERRHGHFLFRHSRDGNGILYGNRTEKAAGRRKNADEISAAVRHINFPLRVYIAVVPEGHQAVARTRSRGLFID